MEKERRKMRDIAEHKSESEALSIAIEERRRINRLAQEKKEAESKDIEFAKQIILQEIENDFKASESCKNDEEYARKVKLSSCSPIL